MKALTLYQPWATLVAIEAKRIETRSWSTGYRGPLMIHASKNKKYVNMRGADYICDTEPFYSVLMNQALTFHWQKMWGSLPMGAFVATCELVGCVEMRGDNWNHLSQQEKAFGNYCDGRYMWFLENIKILAEPIPARGALGLFEAIRG
jgi:activating signal cointegrator 1